MHSVIFFTKFDFHNSAFESLFSQIIRVWKLFWLVVTYFSCKLLCLQWEFALPLNIEQVTTNLENLEKCQFLTKSGKTWKSQGKILKMVFRLLVFWKFFSVSEKVISNLLFSVLISLIWTVCLQILLFLPLIKFIRSFMHWVMGEKVHQKG